MMTTCRLVLEPRLQELQGLREMAAGFRAFLGKILTFMVGFRLLVLLLVVPACQRLLQVDS
jgi:hypothetical protein